MAIPEDLDLIEKLKAAAVMRLEISQRMDKPNLPVDEAIAVISLLPAVAMGNPKIQLSPNQTKPYQPFYDIGRDEVFVIRFKVLIRQAWKNYYIKGFFFNREEIVGVYLISVREL